MGQSTGMVGRVLTGMSEVIPAGKLQDQDMTASCHVR
jgi:hypothetical protein